MASYCSSRYELALTLSKSNLTWLIQLFHIVLCKIACSRVISYRRTLMYAVPHQSPVHISRSLGHRQCLEVPPRPNSIRRSNVVQSRAFPWSQSRTCSTRPRVVWLRPPVSSWNYYFLAVGAKQWLRRTCPGLYLVCFISLFMF
jgi:hypothetical protein